MKNPCRITSNADFRSVYTRGRRVSANGVRLIIAKGKGPRSRAGFVVAGAKKAVERNRIKRYLREAYRTHEKHVKAGLDVVVIARANSRAWRYTDIEQGLIAALEKGRLVPK